MVEWESALAQNLSATNVERRSGMSTLLLEFFLAMKESSFGTLIEFETPRFRRDRDGADRKTCSNHCTCCDIKSEHDPRNDDEIAKGAQIQRGDA